uniref:Integrase zinc-binding domain-containing protein n=1 Tax=Anopheles epiroticus TaxID=199890 RepID=A0A182PWL5_9DIPT
MMDQHGILRMEGRTANAEILPFDLRFPMILPNNHPITLLIVKSYHERCGHGYRQAVKNELRQLYYIPHVDAVVRKVASSCVWCKVKRNHPETKWTFNPPAAPHMGGVWERLVRSLKAAMTALDDGRRLTDEILLTVIVEAEDVVNSRPLTTVTQEDGVEVTLTPNLFLRGYSSSDSRSQPTTDTKGALKDHYLRTQQLTNEFWIRWIKEYVPGINLRTKWHGETRQLRTGDLVYIVDGDNRQNWRNLSCPGTGEFDKLGSAPTTADIGERRENLWFWNWNRSNASQRLRAGLRAGECWGEN